MLLPEIEEEDEEEDEDEDSLTGVMVLPGGPMGWLVSMWVGLKPALIVTIE